MKWVDGWRDEGVQMIVSDAPLSAPPPESPQPMGARWAGLAAHWLARSPRASSRRSSRSLSLHILQSMDYTVSLQVEHQLAVFPTHLYQEYSVEVQMKSTEVDHGLFTDSYCKVCSAQLISESQRVAHYEGHVVCPPPPPPPPPRDTQMEFTPEPQLTDAQ
ncbi:hypothetical protein F7725_012202 [Dissostichus mawsoni]|uniref:C2H2-type domain-containing protein n=1 Tax=Dissostichus mawsoni TaxID=36200 RepID=A0A7J5YM33_DISMA|nr:hypothetical protein F7725_012202 [Dissostichus mawsoni]